ANGIIWTMAQVEALAGVASSNHSPVAVADSVSVNENGATANLVATLLANDTDPDLGDTRSITAVNTAGTVGTVAFNNSTNTLTYTANGAAHEALRQGTTLTDTFGYSVRDSHGASSATTVTV